MLSRDVMDRLNVNLLLTKPRPTNTEDGTIIPHQASCLNVPQKNFSGLVQLKFLRKIARAVLIILKEVLSVENVKADGAGRVEGFALLSIG
jgi:hypothetical protein